MKCKAIVREWRRGFPRQFAAGILVPVLMLIAACPAFSSETPRFCLVRNAVAVHGTSHFKRTSEDRASWVRDQSMTQRGSGTARPGDSVYARLVNFGVKRTGYGLEFTIERYTAATGWFVDPASPKGPWPKVGGLLDSGSAGRCYHFDIPTEQPSGRYRFSTKIDFHLDSARPLVRRTAEFLVR